MNNDGAVDELRNAGQPVHPISAIDKTICYTETYHITSRRNMPPILSLPTTAARIAIAKKTVQIKDLIHCITMFATGPSLCVADRMISTITMIIVKTENANWIAAAAL